MVLVVELEMGLVELLLVVELVYLLLQELEVELVELLLVELLELLIALLIQELEVERVEVLKKLVELLRALLDLEFVIS